MKVIKLSIISILSVYLIALFAETDSVVLQNGLNEYNGCIDAWLHDGYYSSSNDNMNHGDDDELIVYYGNDGSR